MNILRILFYYGTSNDYLIVYLVICFIYLFYVFCKKYKIAYNNINIKHAIIIKNQKL